MLGGHHPQGVAPVGSISPLCNPSDPGLVPLKRCTGDPQWHRKWKGYPRHQIQRKLGGQGGSSCGGTPVAAVPARTAAAVASAAAAAGLLKMNQKKGKKTSMDKSTIVVAKEGEGSGAETASYPAYHFE